MVGAIACFFSIVAFATDHPDIGAELATGTATAVALITKAIANSIFRESRNGDPEQFTKEYFRKDAVATALRDGTPAAAIPALVNSVAALQSIHADWHAIEELQSLAWLYLRANDPRTAIRIFGFTLGLSEQKLTATTGTPHQYDLQPSHEKRAALVHALGFALLRDGDLHGMADLWERAEEYEGAGSHLVAAQLARDAATALTLEPRQPLTKEALSPELREYYARAVEALACGDLEEFHRAENIALQKSAHDPAQALLMHRLFHQARQQAGAPSNIATNHTSRIAALHNTTLTQRRADLTTAQSAAEDLNKQLWKKPGRLFTTIQPRDLAKAFGALADAYLAVDEAPQARDACETAHNRLEFLLGNLPCKGAEYEARRREILLHMGLLQLRIAEIDLLDLGAEPPQEACALATKSLEKSRSEDLSRRDELQRASTLSLLAQRRMATAVVIPEESADAVNVMENAIGRQALAYASLMSEIGYTGAVRQGYVVAWGAFRAAGITGAADANDTLRRLSEILYSDDSLYSAADLTDASAADGAVEAAAEEAVKLTE